MVKAKEILAQIKALNGLDILKEAIEVDKKAKEKDLAEAYMTAVETLKDDQIPEDVTVFYNTLREEEDAGNAEVTPEVIEEEIPVAVVKEKIKAKKEEKKSPAKVEKKVEKKEVAKMEKKPAKIKAEKKPAKIKAEKKSDKVVNKYGHREGSQAADIDVAFEKGGTIEDMAKNLKLSVSRIKSHYQHMVSVKKINFVKDDKKGTIKIKK
jgi:hypothetical protein